MTYIARQTITELLGCLNKWTRIKFTDGHTLTAYISSVDTSYLKGYFPRNAFESISCKGRIIHNTAQGQACINQYVRAVLPNRIPVSLYLTHFDDQLIGGTIETGELLALSDKISGIEC